MIVTIKSSKKTDPHKMGPYQLCGGYNFIYKALLWVISYNPSEPYVFSAIEIGVFAP